MRLVQNGIANNFGLVGKNIRKYLTTTALTATGLMAIATPALADGSWTDHQYVEGNATVTTPNVNTTNIQQHTSTVIAKGTASIYEGDTVNVNMNSSKDKYVVYDIKSDPTKIMGNLNSNGRIYIFDQNGVIFGENSQVNVGGIIASTGHISNENIKAGKDIIENIGGNGEVVNNGTITVSEGGLAAFVAPAVRNNGVINAKAGTVALASGNTVTLDLYGDGLVSIAADGELANAIIENKGTINASGGNVALTVAAAKDAVDSVVNMDGVINVSSSTGKGGKVKIDGGNKGAVSVTGTIDASGQGGGDIDIKGENVLVTSSAGIYANAQENGNGGNIKIWGNRNSFFFGLATARGGSIAGDGGFVEVSAGDSVAYAGLVDTSAANGNTGRFLIDPEHVVLGTINPVVMLANIGLDILLGGTFPTLVVDQQALANTLHTTDVDLWATGTISTAEDIDISEYDYNVTTPGYLNTSGPIWTWHWVPAVITNYNGITANDLTLAAPTVNINHDITLGTGSLLVQDLAGGISPLGLGLLPAPHDIVVNELNLDGRMYKREALADTSFSTLADDDQLFTTADTINVLSSDALIQQAIYFADETTSAAETINIAADTYAESVKVDRSVSLLGANAGVNPNTGAWGAETIIEGPDYFGIYVTAPNVTIKGLTIKGDGTTAATDYGILTYNANNLLLENNKISDSDFGTFLWGDGTPTDSLIQNNRYDNPTGRGIFLYGNAYADVLSNTVFANIGITTENFYRAAVDGIRSLIDGNVITASSIGIRNNLSYGTQSGFTISNNTILASDPASTRRWTGVDIISQMDGVGTNFVNNDIDGAGAGSRLAVGYEGTNLTAGNTVIDGGDVKNVKYGVWATDGSFYTGAVNDLLIQNVNFSDIGEAAILAEDVWDAEDPSKSVNSTGTKITIGTGNTYTNTPYELAIAGENITVNDDAVMTTLVKAAGLSTYVGEPSGYAGGQWEVKNASINQAIDYTKATGSVYVEAGTFAESVYVDKSLNLYGNNKGINPNTQIRNPETIIDPFSPGFHVVANDVLIDGFTITGATGSDGYGVWAQGVDNTKILNNIINDVTQNGVFSDGSTNTVVSNNEIDNTGSHGIVIKGGSDARVYSNFIGTNGAANSIVGDAIQINASHGAWVKYNQLTNTTQTSPNIGSGVHSISSNSVVIEENKTWKTAWDGVRVNRGSNVLVKKNDIDDALRTGVYLGQTSNSSAVENDIDKVGNYGVNLDRGSNVTADGNFIDNTGLSGIQAYNNKSTIKNNKIGQTAVANNIKGNGIYVEAGKNTTVDNNKIGYTVGDGIHVIATNGAQVTKNDIDVTGDEGIHMINAVGTLKISENTVDQTKKHGIRVTNSDKVQVLKNYVGLTGGVQNINGDGIRVEFSDDVVVKENEVTNTRSPHNNQGSGVHSIESNRTQILNNKLWNTKWDGVRVEKGDGVVVRKNDIDDVTRSGVFAIDTTNTLIKDNFIDRTGHRGVYVYNGNKITIDNNDIDYALGSDAALNDGIRADNVSNLVIKNNDIGEDAGANNIGRYGIYVNNSDYAVVHNNDITNTVDDGIHVNPSDYVDISYNDIRKVGGDGIQVVKGVGVDIWRNFISRTDFDGIQIDDHSDAKIWENVINRTGSDGIQVEDSSYILIKKNLINDSGADGIDLENVYTAEILQNYVGDSNDSGIEVSRGDAVLVKNNFVNDNSVGFFAAGDGNGKIEVSGNTFRNNTIGAEFHSGIIDLTGPTNYFYNGRIGMYFVVDSKDPTKLSLVRAGGGDTYDGNPYDTFPTVPYNPVTFGGTIGEQYFRGQTSEFVRVGDNTLVDPVSGEAIWLDGSNSSYYFPLELSSFIPAIDGVNPDRSAFLEEKFYHRVDFDNRGIFFFYPVDVPLVGGDDALPPIEQSLIFNRFNVFNGDATGLNVQIVSLPSIGSGAATTPAVLNTIGPFAGNNATDPSALNQIETAAGGEGQTGAAQLNQIETAAGGEAQNCWGNAVAAAGNGQVVNVVYTGGDAANLTQAAACGTGF